MSVESIVSACKTGLLAMGAFALAGCTVGPAYVKPQVEVPAAWSATSADTRATYTRWWSVYADPLLERLIDEALASNPNLLLAAGRVEEARALFKSNAAEATPSALLNADAARSRLSQRGSQPLFAGSEPVRNSYRVTLDVFYEVDLWGRLRNASRAARAELLATEAARETVRITLAADVAQTYFALRSLDAQIDATRRSLDSRAESLSIQEQRVALGVLSDFEFRQREAEVAAARAQLPALERQRAQQETVLAILLGRSPKAIYEGRLDAGEDSPDANVPIVVPQGLPSELLLRRPDIVQAEQALIAANARIGAARALYFPAISLTGFLGGESAALSGLVSGPALIWQVAAGLTYPIFGGSRIDAQVEIANAREQQALAQYRIAAQNAFREVRDALVAQQKAREQLEAERARVAALNDTLRLARLRYDNGLANQLDVLDAERNLLAAEQNRIDALRAQRAAIADLFRALGGGWS